MLINLSLLVKHFYILKLCFIRFYTFYMCSKPTRSLYYILHILHIIRNNNKTIKLVIFSNFTELTFGHKNKTINPVNHSRNHVQCTNLEFRQIVYEESRCRNSTKTNLLLIKSPAVVLWR